MRYSLRWTCEQLRLPLPNRPSTCLTFMADLSKHQGGKNATFHISPQGLGERLGGGEGKQRGNLCNQYRDTSYMIGNELKAGKHHNQPSDIS